MFGATMTYHEEEITVFRTSIKYLQFIALFPRNGSSYSWKLYLRYSIPLVLMVSQVVLGQIGDLYQSYLNKNFNKLVYDIYYLAYVAIFQCAAFFFLNRGKELLKFLKMLSKFEDGIQEEYRKIIQGIDEYSRKWFHINWIFILIIAYESYRKNSFCDDIKYNDPRSMCRTILPLWYSIKFDVRMNLYFVVLEIVLSIYYVPLTITGLSVCHIHKIISLRSRYLVELLKKLDFNGRMVKKTKSEIYHCVKIHMEIRDVIFAFNDSLGYIAASSQNACNNLMIGMCAYLIIKEQRYIYIFSIGMWSVLQWISCYAGQAVEDANELVRLELYNTKWYDMDPSLRNTFKTFQAQVSLPIRLKVKPLLALSMEHLTNVMKGAYSILMFLLRM